MREPSIARIAWLQLSRLRMQGLIAACLLLAAPLVRANVILVAPGAVATGGSTCSLVDAINAANSNTATGAITTTLNFTASMVIENMSGRFIYALASPTGRFAPAPGSAERPYRGPA